MSGRRARPILPGGRFENFSPWCTDSGTDPAGETCRTGHDRASATRVPRRPDLRLIHLAAQAPARHSRHDPAPAPTLGRPSMDLPAPHRSPPLSAASCMTSSTANAAAHAAAAVRQPCRSVRSLSPRAPSLIPRMVRVGVGWFSRAVRRSQVISRKNAYLAAAPGRLLRR